MSDIDRVNNVESLPDTLAEINKKIEEGAERPKQFLDAWKKGIKLVGKEYFKINGDLESATDKWDLKPNKNLIEHSLTQLSKGQATLLAVMYSFYNGDEGQLYLEQLGRPNISDIAAHLDKEYLEVIAELFINYSGW